MPSICWRVRAALGVAGIAVAMVTAGVARPARTWGQAVAAAPAAPRVAFVNAAELDRGAKTLIESLWPGLVQDGYQTVPPGELREVLEAPLAASEDRLGQARAILVGAKDAYAGFQFESALESLARVDPLLADQPYSDKLVEILAERYVLEGLVHAGAKDPARAEAAFGVVKRLRPDRQLDPATYHPRVVALFAQAGGRAGPDVAIRIDAPPGARIVVDGAEVGPSLVSVTLAPGTHYVHVDHDGFIPVGAAVEVTPTTGHLSFPLTEAPPADRAARLRDALRASKSPAEYGAAAAGICGLAEADIVVIVRSREGVTYEAAVYRCAAEQLGDWVALPSAQFFAALGPAAGPARAEPARNLQLTDPPGPERNPGGKRGWYRTWWGVGLIATATVATGTALYFTLRPEDQFVIGTWCLDEECGR